MANAVYPKYKESVLKESDTNNGLDGTTTAAPYVALVDTGTYTYSSSHQFYSSLSGVVGTDQPITTPVVTNGTFDGDDVTFTAVSGASGRGAGDLPPQRWREHHVASWCCSKTPRSLVCRSRRTGATS
jgi:hypothetical protein